MQYLIELLDKETHIYNRYLELASQKKKALIENDIDCLDSITEEEKDLSAKILALEAARIEYLREQGYPGNIHINDLVEQVTDQVKIDLEARATALREILRECKKFHDGNAALLKQSSNYINHMIKVFSTTLNGGRAPVTYSKGTKKFESGQIADMQG